MIYQTYPEKCLPTQLTPSGAQFPDGVYMDTHDIDDAAESVVRTSSDGYVGTFSVDSGLILVDAQGPFPSNDVMSGKRRVRAPNASVQVSHNLAKSNNTYLIAYVLSLVVRRQGSSTVFARDILATIYANRITRISSAAHDAEENSEDLNIVYPGMVELNSGDELLVRVTGQVVDITGSTSVGQSLANLTFSISKQAFIKFL